MTVSSEIQWARFPSVLFSVGAGIHREKNAWLGKCLHMDDLLANQNADNGPPQRRDLQFDWIPYFVLKKRRPRDLPFDRLQLLQFATATLFNDWSSKNYQNYTPIISRGKPTTTTSNEERHHAYRLF